jgi:hypothetical protein
MTLLWVLTGELPHVVLWAGTFLLGLANAHFEAPLWWAMSSGFIWGTGCCVWHLMRKRN